MPLHPAFAFIKRQYRSLPSSLLKLLFYGVYQYRKIARFCKNTPEIWDCDRYLFQPLITAYLDCGASYHAYRAAQRFKMLDWARFDSPKHQIRWLHELSESRLEQDRLHKMVKLIMLRTELEMLSNMSTASTELTQGRITDRYESSRCDVLRKAYNVSHRKGADPSRDHRRGPLPSLSCRVLLA